MCLLISPETMRQSDSGDGKLQICNFGGHEGQPGDVEVDSFDPLTKIRSHAKSCHDVAFTLLLRLIHDMLCPFP
jgi:hypothetical protein